MKPTVLLSAFSFAAATAARAGEPAVVDIPVFDELDRIVVTATLNERAQKDVANDVSVIDADQIDRRQMQGIADLVRYEPGVGVTAGGSGGNRFGVGGFSIRGLSGNRVRIEVDGVAVPDSFAIGSYSNAGRDLVDVDALKRVEIVRGAASSLYGSDALAGVVSFVTKDPSDYVGADGGEYGAIKETYDSANRESATTATFAAAGKNDGIVFVATHRDGSALNNQGAIDSADATRTRPNPQSTDSDAVLAKFVHNADSGRVDRVILDATRGGVDTDVLSGVGFNPMTNASTTSLEGRDSRERLRLAFEQHLPLATAVSDAVDWNVYAQTSSTGQDTFENRITLTQDGSMLPSQRFRRFDFDQRVIGAEAIAHKALEAAGIAHDITYGIEGSRTQTSERRDGYQRNLLTGTVSNVVLPDVFPVRDFPKTDTTSAAVFAQDEMRLLDDRLRLIPALRYEHYKLDPEPDAIFLDDNPGVATTGLASDNVSPKLGAIWRFDDVVSAYAQFARGFRSPPYNDVNIGFTNVQFGYTAIANPNLKPETSHGVEAGFRASGAFGYASVGAYDNRYRDFIDSQHFVGVDPDTGLIVFQSINLSRVRIRGVEARFGLDFGAFSEALSGFSLKGNAATAHGDDESARQPLASVDPARAVVGIAYDRDDWGAELLSTFVERKTRLPAPGEGESPAFAPGGFATLDAYAHLQPQARLELFAAITNLTGRRYFDWATVNGIPFDPNTIDRYSAPGRAARVAARVTF